jgi:hypothetical protein
MTQLKESLNYDKGSTIHDSQFSLDYLVTNYFTEGSAALFVMFREIKDSSSLEYSDRGTYWSNMLHVSLRMDPKEIAPIFAALSKYSNQAYEGIHQAAGNSSAPMSKSIPLPFLVMQKILRRIRTHLKINFCPRDLHAPLEYA